VSLDARPTVDQPDEDPYLWLEDIEGARALAWVEAETERTLKAFGSAQFTADRDTLAAILDRPDKLPFIARRGPWLYNFWLDAKNPRGLWRRCFDFGRDFGNRGWLKTRGDNWLDALRSAADALDQPREEVCHAATISR